MTTLDEIAGQLPIAELLPPLLRSLRTTRNFAVQAEPGAGKTTVIPPALLHSGLGGEAEIWVAQPRRLAARMAARRVATSLAEPVGRQCGYQVRFETKAGPDTRIRFVTEGILARRLRHDPALKGVSTVVLDEFHERHLDADISLALLRRLQRNSRPDLRIGVMSATLELDAVATYLDCPPLRCPGRTFPVRIDHLDKVSDRTLGVQVSRAVRTLAEDGLQGSILVFLPGAREIRECLSTCESAASHLGLELVALHGDLPAAEQDRVVEPGSRPKLILSTNVAETSVTIEGVTAVIDSGLARQANHNPWTGVPTLSLAKISQASAVQRAGRAGRTAPGRCLRLYTRADFERRPAFDAPELARLDLTEAMLDLRAAGVTDFTEPTEFRWFEDPPVAAVDAAQTLLARLQAIGAHGEATAIGRAMLNLGVHPRLARLVVEAGERGIPGLGTTVAALLSERPIRRRSLGARRDRADHRVAMADVLLDVEDLKAWKMGGAGEARRRDLDVGACQMVDRVRSALWRQLGSVPERSLPAEQAEEALCVALLTAFPDRIGRVRDDGREVVFAEGGSAELDETTAVHGARFLVVLDVEERTGGTRGPRTRVRSAAAVELDTLLEHRLDDVEEAVEVVFDPKAERVTAHEELRLGAIVLETRRCTPPSQQAAAVLAEAALARGAEAFVDPPQALIDLQARSAFGHQHAPEIPVIDQARIEAALGELCEGARTFAELRRADLLGTLLARLPGPARAALERFAPTHVSLPGGRRLPVHYELDRSPWVQSRLQDFFGSSRGPTVADGRVPLVLHLLAPNQRAVQVSTDLAGFWERHYPDLRKQLMRRYPKHDWPEDPRTARPPAPRRTRRRSSK